MSHLSPHAFITLIAALSAIVTETMDNPPAQPSSCDSYLPPELIEGAQYALELATGNRVAPSTAKESA